MENAPPDDRIRLVVTQSCERDGKETDPDTWILQQDLGARCEPRQLRALFDGISEQLEGEHGKILVAPPNKRNKKNSKSSFWLEHYYPQKSARWEDDLSRWEVRQELMENRLNALGNLSILTDFGNQKMSNKPLLEKQAEYRTAQVASFKINFEFTTSDRWTHKEIDDRTVALLEEALKFWAIGS